ncbi:hypothetical protein [Longispora albida]|uniref:hypothetical protein n=1 Tax=Longispora albida TaxID=203523 RepID=UPI0003741514|nr:hypothetical protein [Longispora albida]
MRDLYSGDEWDLLVDLPRSVVIAATTAQADNPRRTVTEGMAGHAGIQAGQIDDSPLVRAVYAELFLKESDPESDELPAAEVFNNPERGLTEVLTRARRAAVVLAAKAEPEDAIAYRIWIGRIAGTVAEAAKSGGFIGLGGERVTPAERRFLEQLDAALS